MIHCATKSIVVVLLRNMLVEPLFREDSLKKLEKITLFFFFFSKNKKN